MLNNFPSVPGIQFLADGVKQCNQEYIERPHLDHNDYITIIMEYLLLSVFGADNFGLYDDPEQIGYVGYLKRGDCTLFFGPTKAIVLCGNEQSRLEVEDS